MAYNSTFVILSSLESLFFNGLKGLDHRVGHRAEIEAFEHGVPGIISRKFSVRARDEISAGCQKRFHLEKQYVLQYVASYAEKDVPVLDSKTSRVTPG